MRVAHAQLRCVCILCLVRNLIPIKSTVILVVGDLNIFLNHCLFFVDVVVHRNGYASYTQKLASSNLNHFQIQFRTKDHTGLLMHATGGSDFVTLELINGKLRYI